MRFQIRAVFVAVLLIVGFLPHAQAQDLRVIDVAEVTWSGAPSPIVSTSQIALTIQDEVNPNWISFTSTEGDPRDRSISFKHGQTLNTPIRLTSPLNCEQSDFTGFMNSVRNQVYRQLGIENWRERYLVILSPAAGCIWSGRATVGNVATKGGVMVLHNNGSGFVITHELGHSLGLGHSNLLRCDNGARDGAWSRNCKAVEYGGSIDVMGNVETTSPLSTYHQWRMGLIDKTEIKQSWLNESIDLSASDVFGGTRAIFIRDGNSSYWIEYRRPRAGVGYNAGLVVYRTDPPSPRFIDSPNPEDRIGFEPGQGVAADYWMLNLDNYSYAPSGRSSGSMTLTKGRSTTFYSGAVTIEAVAGSDESKITVRVSRRIDSNPPPVPKLTPTSSWRFPGAEILEAGYDDRESAIASFEALVDDQVVAISSKPNENLEPTFLDPFITRKSLYVSDLPEGSYRLSIRATDVWGNKSEWSAPTQVIIDRGAPNFNANAVVVGQTSDSLRLSFTDLRDVGSGLCTTQLINEDGFVLQASSAKASPELLFGKNAELKSAFRTYDCLGNGVTAELSAKTNFVPANKSSRTGRWVNTPSLGEGALTCTTKCSASFTSSGKVNLLIAEGAPSVVVSGRTVARAQPSNLKSLRTGAIIELGSQRRVMRVTGSNFTLIGIAKVDLELTKQREISRAATINDPSLADPVQRNMSKYGFSMDDFADGWIVLPMPRGTTLADPTLDLCSASYKSESGRQHRRQVAVTKVGSPYLFLSSETVKYKDKDAADAALAELKARYADCVKNKGGIESNGSFVDYIFSTLPESKVTLVPERSRVIVRAQIGNGVTARQLLALYQFNGEMFTGLYVVTPGESPISDNETKRWFEAASVLAKRLEAKF